MISYMHNKILKQKNVIGSGLEGTPKLLKAFFFETIFMSKLRNTRSSNSGRFLSTDLKFGSVITEVSRTCQRFLKF